MRSIGRRSFRKWSLLVSVAMFAFLLIPFAGPAAANHGDRKLDVQPETATRGIGATHTMTARLCESDPLQDPGNCDTDAPANQSSGAIRIHFENENGPNDPDNSISRNTPDLTCNIFPSPQPPAQGPLSCDVSYVGTRSGSDVWRAWIDHDGDASTDDSDATEGRSEQATPGSPADDCGSFPGPAEPDCTDVVQVTWTEGAPAKLDCDDETGPDTERETNPSGGAQSNETYSCEVRDAQGNVTGDANPNEDGVQSFRVHAEVENGTNDPDPVDGASYATEDYGCNVGTTNAQKGRCSITVTQAEGELGTAEICFWVGTLNEETGATLCSSEPTDENQDQDGSDTGNDLADQTEKTWEASDSAQGGLDAEPETAGRVVGTEHTITATVYDQFRSPFNGNTQVKFEFFQGSASDSDGNTPATPDKTCTTENASSCSVTYTSNTPGRDLVCVWTNEDPAMTGTEQNGMCDGEGQVDQDDTAGSADAPEPRNDDVDVVSVTWRNQNPATELNCEPENATTERSDNHVITCTASNQNGGVSGTNVDVEAVGANDPDNGNTPGTPDFTCTTGNDGTCQITHDGSSTGNDKGETTYRAWIDEDYRDDTNESDADEGQNSENEAGATDEPDNTDVVKNRWIADPDRTISLNANRRNRSPGQRVRFFGDIDGDPSCEDGETVRLRRSTRRGFKTMATTVSDNDGGYEFVIRVRKTRRYRAVTPATSRPDACDKAVSNTVKVKVN